MSIFFIVDVYGRFFFLFIKWVLRDNLKIKVDVTIIITHINISNAGVPFGAAWLEGDKLTWKFLFGVTQKSRVHRSCPLWHRNTLDVRRQSQSRVGGVVGSPGGIGAVSTNLHLLG